MTEQEWEVYCNPVPHQPAMLVEDIDQLVVRVNTAKKRKVAKVIKLAQGEPEIFDGDGCLDLYKMTNGGLWKVCKILYGDLCSERQELYKKQKLPTCPDDFIPGMLVDLEENCLD